MSEGAHTYWEEQRRGLGGHSRLEYRPPAQDAWSTYNAHHYSAANSTSSAALSMASTAPMHVADCDDASHYDSLCSQAATVTSLVLSQQNEDKSLASGPSFSWEHANLCSGWPSQSSECRLASRQQRNHPYHRPAEADTAKNAAAALRNHRLPVMGFEDLRSMSCVYGRAQSTSEPTTVKTDDCDDSEWTLGPGKPSGTRPATQKK